MVLPVPEPTTPSNPTPSPEAMALHGFLKIIDAPQNGVGLDRVRPMYPRVGWNVILGHCAELEDAGMLTKVKVVPDNGRGGHDVYTWQ